VQTSDRIIEAEKNGANMDLQSQAENESTRRTRSKLEAHREAILALRRKHWTYRQIAHWLNEHGVPVTFPSVYRFCERAIARRPRSSNPFPAIESAEETASFPIPTPPTTTKPNKQYRFNMDI
jgi:hypothetical protein